MVQTLSQEKNQIHWKQLWSLACLYGAVVIGWIAYQNYQPKLLVKFAVTDFSFLLLVFQGIILVVTPPIAGRLGDRYRVSNGHRIPIIMTGISFAAMVFMAVAFTLLTNPGEAFKWILPILIVCWLIAMSIFTSPALSTVELFTPIDKLPEAMAILTIVANLIYALEPVIVDIIDYLGAPITFMAGGTVLFLSGYALKKNSLNLFSQQDQKEQMATSFASKDSQKSQFIKIFLLGLGLGIPTAILFSVFPELLGQKLAVLLNGLSGKIILVYILVLSALISLPASNLVNKAGLERSLGISLVFIVICMISILFFQAAWVVVFLAVVFTVMFTVLSVSSLPLAIRSASHSEKVFCVGIFFSGVALPDGILAVMQAM
jgi:Major Facilitator Superfamily